MSKQGAVSKQLLQRLVVYLGFLKALPDNIGHISATAIAEGLGWGDVQVRKDLAAVSSGGRPKVGYEAAALIADIEQFLGCGSRENAILVGAGNLGRALLTYQGFEPYGLHIVSAFDTCPDLIGEVFAGKPVSAMESLPQICKKNKVSIGILTVPPVQAQQTCNLLIDNGVKAIWNFAPTHLTAPDGIHIHNENMAASLALLSNHLSKLLDKTG